MNFRGDNEKDIFKENLAIKNNFIFYRVFVKNKLEKSKEIIKLINYIQSL
jgi:hypothetical protein